MKYSDVLTCDLKCDSTSRTNVLNLADYPHFKDSDLFRLLKHLPKLSVRGPWVAGGAVWRTVNKEPLEKCDVDIFFSSTDQYQETVIKMNALPMVNNVVKETKNKWNTIYKVHVHEKKRFDKTFDVQLINMNFHRSLEALLDSFDLTVCQFGYDGENLRCGLSSLDDLAAKRIKFHSLKLPKTMFKHLHKYLNNGFTISSEETKELAYRLMGMNCWKKSDQPDYDDEEGKEKEVAYKTGYVSPISGREWDGNGYASTASTGAAIVAADAPVVEQEDEMEIDPATLRPRRQAHRGERVEIGGRNRRVVDTAPLQANAGWYAGRAERVWGHAGNGVAQGVPQWATLAPQPAAPPIEAIPNAGFYADLNVAQQMPAEPGVVDVPIAQPRPVQGNPNPRAEVERVAGRWEMPAAYLVEGVPIVEQPVAYNERQRGQAIEVLVDQYRNEQIRNDDVMNAARGAVEVRQQAYRNAAQALNNAFQEVHDRPIEPANIEQTVDEVADQEIANNAARYVEYEDDEGLF